mmetsp:Transcript_32212/g.90499  ORF Transcript_32212/g.90499 Transcript_32212/m.90499 type:complete len:219 (+) Transcript_32212:662-1318(+)
MYWDTTTRSSAGTSAGSRSTKMPRPLDEALGFTIQRPLVRSKHAMNSSICCGRQYVSGRKSKAPLPNAFVIRRKFMANRSLRVISEEPGKWLTFWNSVNDWYTESRMPGPDHWITKSLSEVSTSPFDWKVSRMTGASACSRRKEGVCEYADHRRVPGRTWGAAPDMGSFAGIGGGENLIAGRSTQRCPSAAVRSYSRSSPVSITSRSSWSDPSESSSS